MNKIKIEEIEFNSLESINEFLNTKGWVSTTYCRITRGYCSIYIRNNSGNCKSAFVSNLGSSINSKHGEALEEVFSMMELFFSRVLNKLVFTTTLTDMDLVNKIAKRFPLAYCTKVPIGYGNNYQYHCGFFTNNKNYGGYDAYLRRVQAQQKIQSQKRIPGFTVEMKERILNYKSKYWLGQYLNKLIS